MKISRRHYIFLVLVCLLLYLSISGRLLWRDWSYLASDPYLKTSDSSTRIAVIYYSRSGKTEAMAREIARKFEADLYQISDQLYYQGPIGMLRANRDSWFKKPAPFKSQKLDLNQYKLIFLGSPIWWYRPAPPLWAFVENNSFKGKNIILFNTFNSRFKKKEIDELIDMVETRGGTFVEHIFLRRGRIYNQLSGEELIEAVQQILNIKEIEWQNVITGVEE